MISKAYTDEARRIRRDLHRIPEIGFQEFKTQKYIIDYLTELDLSYEIAAITGVVCFIDMHQDTTIALRSDIDGLSINEQNDVDYKSKHEGCMHACGHDGHIAMLLTYAKYIVAENIQLPNNILLIFQPAEEGPGGAEKIIEEGFLEKYDVSHVFAFHLSPDYPYGMIATKSGEFFASSIEFYVDIKGRSAHGAQPQNGKDSILIGAQLVTALHSMTMKDFSPLEDYLLHIGTFNGGDRLNIIAGETSITGVIRTFNKETQTKIVERMQKICEGYALSSGSEIELRIKYMYPSIIHDEALLNKVLPAISDRFMLAKKTMLAEDFSYYTKELPSLFMLLGIDKNEGSYPLHSDHFNFDEEILTVGIEAYLKISQLYFINTLK